MEEYSVVKNHEPDNITLLCGTHHGEKTSGRLSTDKVMQANAAPFNSNSGYTSPFRLDNWPNQIALFVGVTEFRFSLAEQEYFRAIQLDDAVFFGIERDQGYLIDLVLTDASGKPQLVIHRGEIVISLGVWDYKTAGPLIEIRNRLRDISIRLKFLDNGLHVERGIFYYRHHQLFCNEHEIRLEPNKITIAVKLIDGCGAGIFFHDESYYPEHLHTKMREELRKRPIEWPHLLNVS